MPSLLLRLTLPLIVVIILCVMLMEVTGRLLPITQIIPIVTYGSPTISLVDVNRQLAANRRSNSHAILNAAISPDQQQIAFSMSDNRQTDIYVGSVYDHSYQRVTNDTLGGDNPQWSPDSRQIVFKGLESDNKRGIYTVEIDGTSPIRTIVKSGTFSTPSWSPDGRYLAFASSFYRDLPDIFIVDSACTLRCDRQLIQITNALVADTAPNWSPDGSTLIFLSNRSGSAYQIYTLDMHCLQPGEVKCTLQVPKQIRLLQLDSPVFESWSLDGRDLYFRAWDVLANHPSLYAVEGNCPNLPQGCQPRMIYDLIRVSPIRRVPQ